MKKIVYLFTVIVISAFALKVSAQSNLPQVYEIKSDTAYSQTIDDKYWQILEDPTGNLNINQVSSPAYSNRFHVNTTRTKGYNYNVDTYWLRYTFKNTLAYPVRFTIPEGVAYAWLYIPKANNQWTVQTNGTMVPWSKRDGIKRSHRFLVTIPAGQAITFYERDIFDFRLYKPEIFEMTIGYADPVISKLYLNNIDYAELMVAYSVALGILLVAGLINLLFYLIVREKVYIYFALFLFFTGLYQFFTNIDLLLREFRFIYSYLVPFLISASFFYLMHFIRHYLSTRNYTPRWDKVLIMLSYLQIAAMLIATFVSPTLSFRTYFIINTLCNVVLYAYMPVILITMLFYLRINRNAGRWGVFAMVPNLIWWAGYTYPFIDSILFTLYKKPYSAFTTFVNEWDGVATIICTSWLVIIFSWILFKRYQDLQQSFIQSSLDREIERSQLIEKQNAELEHQVEMRTAELRQSVEELKTTQQQLIQSEKLASLGELTAGIAHEIQNPLNFVNNFSEVSMELAVEMKEELKAGRTEEAAAIADDIEQNLQKIIHHGKRADGIVKNMLQHSRNNSAEKQLTDINSLADEYLRLSYHGLRAKDKSFNSNMATAFDPKVPKVEVIPQDIGRVLLNLFNNAFYAVQQRKATVEKDYRPEVKVSTALKGKFLEIKVTDNGTGIPDSVKGKILQPFFTTKPTGEGTGLGLSLSYDIVVKGHGGTLDINSKEGEYTEFTIQIPT